MCALSIQQVVVRPEVLHKLGFSFYIFINALLPYSILSGSSYIWDGICREEMFEHISMINLPSGFNFVCIISSNVKGDILKNKIVPVGVFCI